MTPWTVAHQLFSLLNSPGRNTGVGCHSLLQGIFPAQGTNPCLFCVLHWPVGFLPLEPPGKSRHCTRSIKSSKTKVLLSGRKMQATPGCQRGRCKLDLDAHQGTWMALTVIRMLPHTKHSQSILFLLNNISYYHNFYGDLTFEPVQLNSALLSNIIVRYAIRGALE